MSSLIKCNCEPQFQIYYNKDSNFGIYNCKLINEIEGVVTVDKNKDNDFTLKGIVPQFELYTSYIITCKESLDKRYGLQYEFVSFEPQLPKSSEEQKSYLKTLLTDLQVQEMFKVYDYPLDEIINGTFDYKLVKGLGKKNYPPIEKKILDNFVLYDLLSELGKYNISYNQVKKIYNKYKSGEVALQKINNDPYVLYRDIDGIGFKKADKIAQAMGIVKEDNPRRIRATIMFILEENQNEGNTWINLEDLKSMVFELINNINVDIEKILNTYEEFYFKNNVVALVNTYNVEVNISKELMRLKNTKINFNKKFNINDFISKQEGLQGFKYTEKQRGLFQTVLDNGVNILTGAAGTGKTKTLNGIINMFDELGLYYQLASPSAKAAKVMTEATGRKASTIHRLLKWMPDGFQHNKQNPLLAQVVIIDEISMVDIWLFRSLLSAIKDDTILIIVGDYFQLESIQAGNILHDMINSEQFNTCQLDKVHRQALDSGIIQIATKCRQGIKFLKNNNTGCITVGNKQDTHIWIVEKEDVVRNTVKSYKELVRRSSIDDVVVLSPTKVGEVGTKFLNNALQEVINPKSEFKKEFKFDKEKLFREGDKVIHVKNNYYADWLDENLELLNEENNNMGIFNGETGVVLKIDNKKVFVDYGEKIIKYSGLDFKQLELAYALTIHKFQGSSCKNVILILDSRSYYQAKRSLLYTGLTRAKEKLVFICSPKIVNYAIDNNIIITKKTFLKNLLK